MKTTQLVKSGGRRNKSTLSNAHTDPQVLGKSQSQLSNEPMDGPPSWGGGLILLVSDMVGTKQELGKSSASRGAAQHHPNRPGLSPWWATEHWWNSATLWYRAQQTMLVKLTFTYNPAFHSIVLTVVIISPEEDREVEHLLCHPLLPDGMPVRFDRASSPTAPALLPSLPSASPSSRAAWLWVASSGFTERPLAVPPASGRAHRHCFATVFQIPCLFSLWGLMICETINHPPSSSGGFKAQATAKFSSSSAKCHSSHLLSFQLPKATVCICQCHLVSLNSSLSPFGSIVINNKWSVGGCRSKHTPVNLHFKLWAADF